jgi:hypothetical protein
MHMKFKPGKPYQSERYTRRWVDKIKLVLEEIRCEKVEWFRLIQDRVQWRDL